MYILDVYALKQSAFGAGDGNIWLNDVDCTGSETEITQCRFDTTTMSCDHSHDAGVKCAAGKVLQVNVIMIMICNWLKHIYYA